MRMCNLSEFNYTDAKVDNTVSFIVRTMEFFVPIPKGIDVDAEKMRLMKDLEYNKGFLLSVQKKLSNERFVQNAKPEVIETEKKKQSDAAAKLKAIQEQLSILG